MALCMHRDRPSWLMGKMEKLGESSNWIFVSTDKNMLDISAITNYLRFRNGS